MDPKYDSINLTLDKYDYIKLFKKEEKELADISPLQSDGGEVKEETAIKI